MDEAEKIYQRALKKFKKEKVLRPEHMLIFNTVKDLGNLYTSSHRPRYIALNF
jgi:hypothetical protein